jgi:hypothetical protein
MKSAILTRFAVIAAGALCTVLCVGIAACSGINDSWEVKGGGFLKYSINDEDEIQQELYREDVEIPYIRNRHHLLVIKIPAGRSARNAQLKITVYSPKLGKDNNIVQGETWIQFDDSPKALITGDSNYVHIDQKDNTKWTATINLHFEDCRQGRCNSNRAPIHFKGRMHYWIAEEDQ